MLIYNTTFHVEINDARNFVIWLKKVATVLTLTQLTQNVFYTSCKVLALVVR